MSKGIDVLYEEIEALPERDRLTLIERIARSLKPRTLPLSDPERKAQLREMLEEMREDPIWTDENHPDLNTVEDVNRYVRELRHSWHRRLDLPEDHRG